MANWKSNFCQSISLQTFDLRSAQLQCENAEVLSCWNSMSLGPSSYKTGMSRYTPITVYSAKEMHTQPLLVWTEQKDMELRMVPYTFNHSTKIVVPPDCNVTSVNMPRHTEVASSLPGIILSVRSSLSSSERLAQQNILGCYKLQKWHE